MEIYTWLSPIYTKSELIELIALVEEGSLEELFIAQSTDQGVAGEKWPVGQVLVFCFSTSLDMGEKIQKIVPCIDMDNVDDEYLEENEGVYTLKNVFYPETEAQEEQIIALLA